MSGRRLVAKTCASIEFYLRFGSYVLEICF